MKNRIILNWLPPADVNFPAPSMTVLKRALVERGYKVDIIYWNILIEDLLNEYLFEQRIYDNELMLLSLFYGYKAYECNNEEYILKQEILLRSIKPQYRIQDHSYYRKHIEKMCIKLENRIREILLGYDVSDVLFWGVSMNLYQWISAIVIVPIMKALNPSIPVVVGGIGTSRAAKAFLGNFECFDIAMWGEGETALVKIANMLSEQTVENNINEIPNIAYRSFDSIVTSKNTKKEYVDLSCTNTPDYDDYFNILEKCNINKFNIAIPVEASRGCHWKQCRFCFLNEGYKYRMRTPESIIKEIDLMIVKYGCYKFNFLDNDIIGKNKARFDHFLELLLELKDKYPDFQIMLAEIITKDIETSTIKKMSLAGFCQVQIGYESPSATLLKKIHKKNSFASNLLFCKWAHIYLIKINGLNVLKGLLEETNKDIKESIDNLHYLRFILLKGYFEHNMSQLAIGESSPYFKELKNEDMLSKYDEPITHLLIRDLIKSDDLYLISQYVGTSENHLWTFFEKVESYYFANCFEYKLISVNEKILYKEYLNKSEVKVIEFKSNSLEWQILVLSNKSVVSKDDCLKICEDNQLLEQTIDLLFDEGILYRTDDYNEMVSVINTDLIL